MRIGEVDPPSVISAVACADTTSLLTATVAPSLLARSWLLTSILILVAPTGSHD